MPDPGELKPFEPLPPPPSTGWEEPSLLAAGLAADPGQQVDLECFLGAMLQANPVLAARCLREAGLPALPELAAAAQIALLERMQSPPVHRRARLAAGLELGRLGDPRFVAVEIDGVQALLPPVVRIPSGRYKIGSHAWQVFWLKRQNVDARNEKPRHAVDLQPFWIGRYPVTNAEYRCFWQAGGYHDDQYWQSEVAASGETARRRVEMYWKTNWLSGVGEKPTLSEAYKFYKPEAPRQNSCRRGRKSLIFSRKPRPEKLSASIRTRSQPASLLG